MAILKDTTVNGDLTVTGGGTFNILPNIGIKLTTRFVHMFMDRVNVQSGTAALNLNLQPNEICTGFNFNSTHNGQHSNNAIFYVQNDARIEDGVFKVSFSREANDGNAGYSLTCTVVKVELILT